MESARTPLYPNSTLQQLNGLAQLLSIFVSQYMLGFQPSARKLWFETEGNKVSGEVLEGRLRRKLADDAEIMQIHEFVITDFVPTVELHR